MGQGWADHPAASVGPTNQPRGIEPPAIPGVTALVRLDGGSLSEVYRGRSTRTGRGVAVKVLPTPFDRDTRAQFDLDRTRLGRLRHVPAILQVDDVEALADGRPYLVTELCSDSLADMIGRGQRLPASTVAEHGHLLATALSMAHGVGIVHGGVSPRNLLFRRSGQPVLSDFGLTLRERYPGDPGDSTEFTAPETLRDGSVTARSDLYCLGATLYAALLGRPPFPARAGEHPSERILRVLSQPAPRVSLDVAPAALAELLAELVATEPDDRPADAASVAERFADLPDLPEPSDPSAHVPVAEPDALSDPDPETAELLADHASTDWSGLLDDALYEPEPESDEDPGRYRVEREPVREPVREPAREPALTMAPLMDADDKPRRAISRNRVASVLAAVIAGVVLLVVLPRLSQGMAPQGTPAGRSASGAGGGKSGTSGKPPSKVVSPPAVQLAAVRDRGKTVELTWRGATSLEYAVVVAGSGLPTTAILAHHKLSLRLPVLPDRPYCFMVQATDGQRVLQSDPRPIRGAVCRL
jgi:serine/threonine protein kinase